MYQKGEDNRSQLITAARQLFLEQGFESTSFQDLADAAGIPKGNIYYYFRSKDEVLAAVIDMRLTNCKARIGELEAGLADPLERVSAYLRIAFGDSATISQFGCPHGSLCLELAKRREDLWAKAVEMFDCLAAWVAEQFKAAGVSGDTHHLALNLIARAEGVALVSAVMRDEEFMRRQVEDMQAWIASLRPTL